MSSDEKYLLVGRKTELYESKEKKIIKIKAFTKLIRENCDTTINLDLERIDTKAIKVFADELDILISELRHISEEISKIEDRLGG